MNNDYFHLSENVKDDILSMLNTVEKGCSARLFGELDQVVETFSEAVAASTANKIPKVHLDGQILNLYSAIVQRTSWRTLDVTRVRLVYDQRKGWRCFDVFRVAGIGARHRLDISPMGWSFIVEDLLKQRGLKVDYANEEPSAEVGKITEVLTCTPERLLAFIGDSSQLKVSDLAEYRLSQPQ